MTSLPTSTLSVRHEIPQDIDDIRELNQLAFGGEDEANLVDRLRDDGDIIASLTALAAGRLVGHALFSRLPIERDGESLAAAALAPMCVHPEHQDQGIGSMLVMRGITILRKRDIAAIIVVGAPAYYERFGFRAELAAPIESPYQGDNFMALEITKGCLAAGGHARYPAAFDALD